MKNSEFVFKDSRASDHTCLTLRKDAHARGGERKRGGAAKERGVARDGPGGEAAVSVGCVGGEKGRRYYGRGRGEEQKNEM